MNESIAELSRILKDSDNIVFFGGVGISTASGIPDFRSSSGLYSKKLNRSFTLEQAVSHTFFIRHPEEFFDFYKNNLVYPKVKPDVVLYEEGLDNQVITGAIHAIAEADTLIIGGTSLVVYPAVGLIDYFRGKHLVLINKSATSADNKADLVINDPIEKVLFEAVEMI